MVLWSGSNFLLSTLRSPHRRIHNITTKAFGIIPVKRENNHWYYFIVQHKAGHWGFPKGHANNGEAPQESAQRELYEETGLSVKDYLPIKPFYSKYTCISHGKKVDKTVTLFTAIVQGTIRLCPDEIADCMWIESTDMHKKISFPRIISLVKKLEQLLEHMA